MQEKTVALRTFRHSLYIASFRLRNTLCLLQYHVAALNGEPDQPLERGISLGAGFAASDFHFFENDRYPGEVWPAHISFHWKWRHNEILDYGFDTTPSFFLLLRPIKPQKSSFELLLLSRAGAGGFAIPGALGYLNFTLEQKAAASLRLSQDFRLFSGAGIRYYGFSAMKFEDPPPDPKIEVYNQFQRVDAVFLSLSILVGFEVQISQKVRLVISAEYFSYYLQSHSGAPGFDLESYNPENAIALTCGVTF